MTTPLQPTLPVESLEERLEALLEAALSSRRTCSGPVHQLSLCCRADQEQILAWVAMLARTNPELAFQFASHAHEATQWLDMTGMRQWLGMALDRYDREGLHGALRIVRDPHTFARQREPEPGRLFLASILPCLETIVHGLGGRRLRIETHETIHTDTETLFLPSRLTRFPDTASNERLYRCLAIGLWAQTRFGTFFPELSARLQEFPDPRQAGALYYILENRRLTALLDRQLPGVGRERRALTASPPWPELWQRAEAELTAPEADHTTSWSWLERQHHLPLPPAAWHHGELMLQRVDCALQHRLRQQRHRFRRIVGEMRKNHLERITLPSLHDPASLTLEQQPESLTFRFHLDGQPLTPPAPLNAVMQEIVQDLGRIPPEYLEAAGDGPFNPAGPEFPEEREGGGTDREESPGATLYDEWDCHRQDYRKGWCVLREWPVEPGEAAFVQETLTRHAGLVRHIRHTFERLRGGEQRLRRQEQGDEVDWEALVEALVEARSGGEMSSRLFQRIERRQRDVATLILVDMSGSTKGWVNEAIRASVLLLCTALEVLQDRFAIHGFTGMTRKRCAFMTIKPFDLPYSVEVQRRIANIQPMEYTRMGVFIRHATHLLNDVEAKIRMLIILSDGKPEDYDGYRGQYGLEDTRKALIEARQSAIHPFCITIDKEARDYLPQLYGPSHFVVLPEVALLPLKIAGIYRKITT